LNAQVGINPFGAVIANNRRRVAFFKPHGHQGTGNRIDLVMVIVPGYIVPEAVLLFSHGHPVTPLIHGAQKSSGNGFVCIVCHNLNFRNAYHLNRRTRNKEPQNVEVEQADIMREKTSAVRHSLFDIRYSFY
jgi:hypothetical protein